jgi:c-di-GMP-binding flagellar brake protein YcgR
VPVQLSSPQGGHLSATLWTVDAAQRRLGFHVEPDHPAMPPMVEGDEITAVAYLEAVKLQFELEHPVLVRSARAATLQAALPRTLYRFQRRAGYRVRTFAGSSPHAVMRHPSIPDMTLTLRVLDVSIGGCAVWLPNDVPPLAPGVRTQRVRIELDGDLRFDSTLVVHHVTSLGPNANGVRLGCEFLQLESAAERALQRYIDQTQKRRRLLTLD